MAKTIGIFDSGLGGLTVVKELKKKCPTQRIVYLGDTARVPYGTRSKQVVEQFALEDAKFLEARGVSEIIIACNTASALAFDAVAHGVSVPVHEVVSSGVKAAKTATKNKKIGVLGTRGTIGSHVHKKLLEGFEVVEQACPLLVPFVEEGEMHSPALKVILESYLVPLKQAGVDTVILGCTHYPLIADLVQELMGNAVVLVNPGHQLIADLDLSTSQEGEDEYYVTDLTPRYTEIAKQFLGQEIRPELVQL